MLILQHEQTVLSFTELQDFYSDGLRISAPYVHVEGLKSRDTLPLRIPALRDEAHRDHIQLVADLPGWYNQQYAAMELDHVSIKNCMLWSPETQCQGIFMSDGLLTGCHITDNTLRIGSAHKITLNGLLSGCIENNREPQGKLVPIQFNPLRIGGGQNVWVIGFADTEYQPIGHIVRDIGLGHVTDNRTEITRPQDTYLTDFRLGDFQQAARKLPKMPVQDFCQQLKTIALQHGQKVNP